MHCLAQMPQVQEYDIDLPDYLYPSFHAKTDLLPPRLLWGWIIDHEKMYQVIEKEWPDIVTRLPYPDPSFAPPKPSEEEEIEEENEEEDDEEEQKEAEWPLDKSKYEHPGYSATLFDYYTSLVLRRRFGIPDDRADLLQIKGLYDDQGVYHAGLTIGTNYHGVLNETIEMEICKFFGIQKEARWYLDSFKWYWTWHPDQYTVIKRVQ